MSAPALERTALRARGLSAAETVVHALAQLPEDARLELPAGPEAAAAQRLARAYGVADRLDTGGVASPGEERTLGEIVASLTPAGAAANPVRKGDDAVFAGQRIALLTNLPAPYRLPLFRALGDRLREAGGELRVIFTAAIPADRPWMAAGGDLGFDHEWCRSVEIPIRKVRPPSAPADLERRLAAFGPTLVLLAGFNPLTSGRALPWARRKRIPVGVWDGDIPGMAPSSGVKLRLRREILARASFAIAYGSSAAAQLRSMYGGPLVIGRNTSPSGPPAGVPGGDGPVRLVTVGDLAGERKGIDIVVDALRLRPQLDCRLTIVGGGSSEAELRARTGGDERITFTGALPRAEVEHHYAASDVFLFPSRRDVFGLALVEGMGAGLASLTTAAPGVAADLAVDGVTCSVVDGHEPARWAEKIEAIAGDAERRRALAAAAADTVSGRWTVEHAADAMLAGLRLGLDGGGR
jgi:glycosyltransferase involved in cell wall biosynthesis